MGCLKYISLIGIGKDTDLDELERLQKKYPLAEFGVILSVQSKKAPTSKRSVGG